MAALVPLPSGLTLSVLAVHDGPFDAVLDVGRVVGRAEHALVVGLVPGHEHRHRLVGVEPAGAELAVLGDDGAHPLNVAVDAQRGSSPPPAQDQVCRNQSVGSTCSRASSGPRLCTVTCMRRSSGESFAYSTKTSK